MQVAAMGRYADLAIDKIFDVAYELNAHIRLDKDENGKDSMLSVFNDGEEDEMYEIDEHIYNMMSAVLDYYEILKGNFDPRIAQLAKLWNVDSEGIAKYGGALNPNSPATLPSLGDVEDTIFESGLNYPLVQDGDSLIKLIRQDDKYYMSKSIPNLKLDLGGIAKGYLADIGGEISKEFELQSASFNISGDLYVYGNHSSGDKWTVGITDPRPRITLLRNTQVAATSISDTGLTTSGDYERYYKFIYESQEEVNWLTDSILVQHIINPKTGIPAGLMQDENDSSKWANQPLAVSSATVVHPSSMIAEMISTACVSAGLEEGVNIAKAVVAKDDGVSVFILEDDSRNIVDYSRYATVGDWKFYNSDKYDEYKRYKLYS